ncbi:hypothetical protein BKI52_03045 [marine bacterium AO1-C]|nr:hypothetical protein BKI52_03045 [marine bacterium AO1-C]
MVVFDSEFLKITYDEANQAVLEEWKLYYGPKIELDSFRQPMLELVKAFKGNKATKWLADNTEQTRLNEKDQWWLEDHLYPQLVEAGLQHVALVNTKNILGTAIAKNSIRNLSRSVEIEIFNKNQDAKNWLGTI